MQLKNAPKVCEYLHEVTEYHWLNYNYSLKAKKKFFFYLILNFSYMQLAQEWGESSAVRNLCTSTTAEDISIGMTHGVQVTYCGLNEGYEQHNPDHTFHCTLDQTIKD